MAELTIEQEKYVKSLLKQRRGLLNAPKDLPEQEEAAFIDAIYVQLDKNQFLENIKEDLMLACENMDVVLSEEQFEAVSRRATNYDYNDYNEFLSILIEEELQHHEEI